MERREAPSRSTRGLRARPRQPPSCAPGSSAPASSAASTPARRGSPERGSPASPPPRPRAPARRRPRSAPTAPSPAPRSWSSPTRSTSSTSAPPTTSTCRWPAPRSRRASTSSARSRSPSTPPAPASSPRAAELAGRVATVPFVYRYYPTVREARARARAGALGELRLLYGGYLQDWLLAPSDDNWRVEPELGGPSRAFADIGSHWCDLVEFVSGQRIVSVSARTAVAHAERPRREARSFARGDGGGVPRAVETEDIADGDVRDRRRDRRLDRDLAGLGRAQEPPLVRALRAPRPRSASIRSSPRPCGSAGARGSERIPRDFDTLAPEAAAYVTLPGGHPQGYRDCFDAFVARDLRRDRGRACRRRPADARRRAARGADHRGGARVRPRARSGWR